MNDIVAHIGLGSNMGDKLANLSHAIETLGDVDGIVLRRVSPVYQTEPVGYVAQEDFLNMVLEIETRLTAHHLLETCLGIEQELGRFRGEFKGPRAIDLDILLYGCDVIETDNLKVPHENIRDREFVLRPLCDLDPELKVPPDMVRVRDLLGSVAGEKRVTSITDTIRVNGLV